MQALMCAGARIEQRHECLIIFHLFSVSSSQIYFFVRVEQAVKVVEILK